MPAVWVAIAPGCCELYCNYATCNYFQSMLSPHTVLQHALKLRLLYNCSSDLGHQGKLPTGAGPGLTKVFGMWIFVGLFVLCLNGRAVWWIVRYTCRNTISISTLCCWACEDSSLQDAPWTTKIMCTASILWEQILVGMQDANCKQDLHCYTLPHAGCRLNMLNMVDFSSFSCLAAQEKADRVADCNSLRSMVNSVQKELGELHDLVN